MALGVSGGAGFTALDRQRRRPEDMEDQPAHRKADRRAYEESRQPGITGDLGQRVGFASTRHRWHAC